MPDRDLVMICVAVVVFALVVVNAWLGWPWLAVATAIAGVATLVDRTIALCRTRQRRGSLEAEWARYKMSRVEPKEK